jgi:hypothetical protein
VTPGTSTRAPESLTHPQDQETPDLIVDVAGVLTVRLLGGTLPP